MYNYKKRRSVNAIHRVNFARADALLRTIAGQRGWFYRRGRATVTPDLDLVLDYSHSSRSGVIVRVGAPKDLTIPHRHTWRKLSCTNDRSDARILLDLSLGLGAIQAQINRNRRYPRNSEMDRQRLLEAVETFVGQTGRLVASRAGARPPASNFDGTIPMELSRKQARESWVKVIQMDLSHTLFGIRVPNSLAAELYHAIEECRKKHAF